MDFDVIVVGGGGAALAAAVTAAEAGASVLIVEAADRLGGVTEISSGVFMAAGTDAQVERGYPGDTAEAFFDYYMTFSRWNIDVAVTRRFCDGALPTMRWLTSHGVEFPADGLFRAGLEPIPRSHSPAGGGLAIVRSLQAAARRLGVDVALGRRVEGLAIEAGRVRGVHADGEAVSGASVILATGGFSSNPALIRQHLPDARLADDKFWAPGVGTNQGDGLALGEQAGAGTAGRNHGDILLSAGLLDEMEPRLPGWLVLVNQEGRRFVDELAPYNVITPLTTANGGSCWAVFDDDALSEARGVSVGAWGAGTWTAETLRGGLAQGQVLQAATVGELAALMNVRDAAFRATLDQYNGDCRAGADSRFGKNSSVMRPVQRAPFYALRLLPSVVVLTGYGLRIDPDTRVLSAADGRPIPGLYAVGEVTGNVLGPQYLGSGHALGSALTFGHIAGRTATADRLAPDPSAPGEPSA